MSCENIDSCPIVNVTKIETGTPNPKTGVTPGLVEQIKKTYCFSNYQACARYMVCEAVGRDFVPPDLLPEELEDAKLILAECEEFV